MQPQVNGNTPWIGLVRPSDAVLFGLGHDATLAQAVKGQAASANPVVQKFVWRPLIPCMQKPSSRADSEETGGRAASWEAFLHLGIILI